MGMIVTKMSVDSVEQMDESEMLRLICRAGEIVYESWPRVIACTEHVLSELLSVKRAFCGPDTFYQ